MDGVRTNESQLCVYVVCLEKKSQLWVCPINSHYVYHNALPGILECHSYSITESRGSID